MVAVNNESRFAELLKIKVPEVAAEYQSIAAPVVVLVADTRTTPVPQLDPLVVTGATGKLFTVAVHKLRVEDKQPDVVIFAST